MKRHGNPLEVVTDHPHSYRAAMKQLGIEARHWTGRWFNNRAETVPYLCAAEPATLI